MLTREFLKTKSLLLPIVAVVATFGLYWLIVLNSSRLYGAPPYVPEDLVDADSDRLYSDFSDWKRPEGPIKVGLQAGHWKNDELPEELEKLRTRGGSSNGKVAEWEVNLRIAKETQKLLEKEGIVVDILPATIPPGYWADAFVAIHADGSTNSKTSGFKISPPWRDLTGKASLLARLTEDEYKAVTGLPIDPNITRNMRGYYAFSFRRFEHAIHPMTPAVILETGFLTNPTEAAMLIRNPELPAQAIAQGVLKFIGILE